MDDALTLQQEAVGGAVFDDNDALVVLMTCC
jgi:hypothetical protein